MAAMATADKNFAVVSVWGLVARITVIDGILIKYSINHLIEHSLPICNNE